MVAPNLPAKPDTLLFNKVTIKGAKQAVQMFGPAQAAVARAVVDSVESGVIPRDKADDLCILVGVFIHWEASDDQKIYDFNYQATKESIARALAGKPSVADVIASSKSAKHPYSPGQGDISAERRAFGPPLCLSQMKKLLIQIDSSPHPSVFDRVVAFDGGADEVMSYGGVAEGDVRDLVHGAIFTRGPKDLHNTAIFVGGTDMAAGERLLSAVKKSFFGLLRVR